MNKIIACLCEFPEWKDWIVDLDRDVPGTFAVKALASAMIIERRKSQKRITFNEYESFFVALQTLALSNILHSLQASDTAKDTFLGEMVIKENHHIVNSYFREIIHEDFPVEQLLTDMWYCLIKDIDDHSFDPEKFENDFLDALEDIIIFSYKILYRYIYNKITMEE